MRASLLASSAIAVALLVAVHDAAAIENADYCSDTDLTCQTAPIAFSKEIVLPIQGGFDTGWVPANSPLQVHLWAQLWANSRVDLAGELETTWPEALTLAAIPTPGAGALSIHYGVDIGAQAHVEVTVLGQTFQWTGDIPYVPQFDFQVEASNPFDPWGFEGVSVNGSTAEATLAQVSVEDFINVNIPGLDGGFELNTYIELTATYRTTAIQISRLDEGMLVPGGPILSENDATSDAYAGEKSIDYAVRPVGEVVYDGVLHLVPAFYIETIGPDFSIPIADIPIPFTFTQKDWDFEPAEVHVPFPDVEIEQEGADIDPEQTIVVDLGELEIGETTSEGIEIANAGEARLAGSVMLAAAGSESMSGFSLDASTFQIAQGSTSILGVSFTASEPGTFVATIMVASNDPDEPVREVEVRALVVDPQGIGDDGDGDGGDVLDAFPEGGGCACEAAGGSGEGSGLLWVAGIAVGLGALRRRRVTSSPS